MKPVAACLLATSLVFSIAAAPATSRGSVPPKDDVYWSKKICRTFESTGSRLSDTSVCRTRAEWEDMKIQSRATVERVQAATSPCLRGGAC